MTLTVRVPTGLHANRLGPAADGFFHKGAAQSLSPDDAGEQTRGKGVFQEFDVADA